MRFRYKTLTMMKIKKIVTSDKLLLTRPVTRSSLLIAFKRSNKAMEYKIRVIETRTFEMEYAVEADSKQEAIEKALIGDTTQEIDLDSCGEVVNRELAYL